MRTALVALIFALLVAPVAAEEAIIEKVLADPPATGLLVLVVGEGTQAGKAGMKVGDVIVSYGGRSVPSIEVLNKAKQASAAFDSIEVKAVREGKVIVFSLKPGPIGVNLAPVEKGVPAPGLPDATGVEFDFSSLAKKARDEWYEFHMPGMGKVGFEHAILSIVDGKLVLRREVAFDGGKQWGLNHFDVTVTMTADPKPTVLSTRFENPITKWVGEGFRDEKKPVWHFAWGGEGHESGSRDMPIASDQVPDYIVESLAGFMPREKGASWHHRAFPTGWPGPSGKSALVCTGLESVLIRGKYEVPAFRFAVVGLAGAEQNKHWVGETGRVLRSDYGGAMAFIATKEEALAGLSEKIVPRTADLPKKAEPKKEKEKPADPLAAAMANPGATGMLVTRVIAGSQAEKASVRPGDILVSYGGSETPDLMSLNMAKERAGRLHEIETIWWRAGVKTVLTMEPGQLGTYMLAVKKGVPVKRLPPATLTKIDLSPLEGKTRVAWHSYHATGGKKLGYIRITARVSGGRLFVKSDFGADQRPEGGFYRAKTSAVVTGDLRPRMTRATQWYGDEPAFSVTGYLRGEGEEGLTWAVTDPRQTSERRLPTGSLPMIVTMTLAELMPRKSGACLHFHPLYESAGNVALPTALVCRGAENDTWLYEIVQVGGTVITSYYVGPDGETTHVEHMIGARSKRAPKAEVVKGLPKEILPDDE